MVRVAALVSFLVLVAGCRSTGGDVRERVEPIVDGARPREVSVAYASLGGERALIDADVVMHAASTMKVAVLIEVLLQAERGRLELDAPIPVENRFESAWDGSAFTLDRGEDGDPQLYDHVGATMTVRELAHRMIARSSNLATNLLLRLVTPVSVQGTIEALGARDMRVVRGVEDQKAYEQGIVNVTTARDLMILMLAIADGSAFATAAARQAAYEVLAAQEFSEMIPAGLPPGTIVLNKTGSITRIHHDAAIVYPVERGLDVPYVLVVLTRGFDDHEDAADVVVRISRTVYAAHTGIAAEAAQ